MMDSLGDTNDQWVYWKQLFDDIVGSHIPTKRMRVRKKCLSWITPHIRTLMRAKRYFHKKAKKGRSTEDWEQYRRLRNQATWSLRKAKKEHFEQLSEQSARNPQKVWKELDRLLGGKYKHSIDFLKVEGEVIMDKQNIAKEFAAFFSSIVGILDEDTDNGDTCDTVPPCEIVFKFERIKEEDVLRLLKGIDPNKAVGVDSISGKILKAVGPGISKSLTSLYNASLGSGQIPREWKSAIIMPVHKGSDNMLVEN